MGFASIAAAQDQAADALIGTVNGVDIRESDLANFYQDWGRAIAPGESDKEKRDFLIRYLADSILVGKAAEQAKIADDPGTARRLMFLKYKILMDRLLETTAKSAVTEDALHKWYDKTFGVMVEEPEAHLRHVMFRVADWTDNEAAAAAEDKAKQFVERLRNGEDFAQLAGKYAEEPAAKIAGGDLGWFAKSATPNEFRDAAFNLEPGSYSDPIKTALGWHVIRIEERRMRKVPGFEEVRDRIQQGVMNQAQFDLVSKLRAEATIKGPDGVQLSGPQEITK